MENHAHDFRRNNQCSKITASGSASIHSQVSAEYSGLKKNVDDTLTASPKIKELIGNNPLQMMYDNHTHHSAFMATVFSIGSYELLARTVPWVYRAYSSHGFSYDYFSLELKAWILAINNLGDSNTFKEIVATYEWMIRHHEDMVHISQTEKELTLPISAEWMDYKDSFLAGLLEGDHRKCLGLAKDYLESGESVEAFYLHVIQPALYEIGMLWERGTISVAQEHLASAIVTRVMATTSMVAIPAHEARGRAVIAASPNEFHETGAWMISDALERQGWEVRYLGANTPVSDLLSLLADFKPDLLAISVTMPFNITAAKELIAAVRESDNLKSPYVVVGGLAFNGIRNLWESTGADNFAANLEEMTTLMQKWEANGRFA